MKNAYAAVGVTAVMVALAGGCAQPSRPAGAMGAAAAPFTVTDPVALSAIRERAISTVQELIASETPQFRANAVEAALHSPDRLKSIIEKGLRDENAGVRAVAAMSVGKGRLAKLAPQARSLLHDSNAYVKSAAIFALARNGLQVDRTPLSNLLLKDPSPQVRAQVAYILGELGDISAFPLLKQSLKSPIPNVSPLQVRLFELQVAEAMIKLGDQRQRPVVRAALYPSRQDELEAVVLACQILGDVNDRESIHQLVSLSEYKEEVLVEKPYGEAKVTRLEKGNGYPPEVQLAIAGALATMKHGDGTFIADRYLTHKSALVRSQVALVYGQIGKVENWGKLDAMMSDTYPGVRVAAAAAVLKSAGPGRGAVTR
ncbi:MAG TPA: HEAT repeat domain-containing protein [Phycisphaerales bacterium]|nr:HEAT repeat domain-containing protein [Phycisphaerales bacterium]